MTTPMKIQDILYQRTTEFPGRAADPDDLCDTATVVWLAAHMLRRYAQEHAGTIAPVHAIRLKQALQTVEHEMHWIRLRGETAQADDLANAVSCAVFHARYAAALLDMDAASATPARLDAHTGHGYAAAP